MTIYTSLVHYLTITMGAILGCWAPKNDQWDKGKIDELLDDFRLRLNDDLAEDPVELQRGHRAELIKRWRFNARLIQGFLYTKREDLRATMEEMYTELIDEDFWNDALRAQPFEVYIYLVDGKPMYARKSPNRKRGYWLWNTESAYWKPIHSRRIIERKIGKGKLVAARERDHRDDCELYQNELCWGHDCEQCAPNVAVRHAAVIAELNEREVTR